MKDGALEQGESPVEGSDLGEEGGAAWESPVLLKLGLAEAEHTIHPLGVDGPASYS